jgi:hypothetical protein
VSPPTGLTGLKHDGKFLISLLIRHEDRAMFVTAPQGVSHWIFEKSNQRSAVGNQSDLGPKEQAKKASTVR